jgi:hypothetical protein
MKFKDLFITHMRTMVLVYLPGDLSWANVGQFSKTMEHMAKPSGA